MSPPIAPDVEPAAEQPLRRWKPVQLILVSLAAVVLVALVVVPLALAFSTDDSGPASAPESADAPIWPSVRPVSDSDSIATPAVHIGPQGRVGQFVATCTYTHSAPDDPIVLPGRSGASHMHDFYGAVGIDADTTPESMLASDTSCNKAADRAAYWHPTLYDHGEPVTPIDLAAYYRPAPGVDAGSVETMPLGLALIAGDMTSTVPQEGDAVGWTCGVRDQRLDDPPVCPLSAPLHLVLTFQDCWDGQYLDSVDHRSHAAYSTDGACPDSHPVHIPQLTVTVGFPIHGEGHELSLASGNVYSLHGDFFNGWEPDGLWREITSCIHREVVCNLRPNRSERTMLDGSESTG